jgi:hypothetical protein
VFQQVAQQDVEPFFQEREVQIKELKQLAVEAQSMC